MLDRPGQKSSIVFRVRVVDQKEIIFVTEETPASRAAGENPRQDARNLR